ncbi:hypothetical protein B0H10DRAFT_2209812 [Mycena sp. CBHHK59/15]|nr:hypothetical protein B0H10DRAFT_2209812 [Mycena sp. CBHHK59/15]
MFVGSLLSVVAAAALVSAQKQVIIQVGGNSSTTGGPIQFIPNSVQAANGTIVTFQFSGVPGNHSVTQSTFGSPCQPAPGGFDSGWVFVNETLAEVPEWNLTITNDKAPIWFYCKQLLLHPHCNAEMVGVINVQTAPVNKDLSAFQAAASAATSVAPGQAEGDFVGIGASATGAPFIPSGAQLFTGPHASATAPAGSASGTGSASSPSESSKPGSALATGFSMFTVLFSGLVGITLV